MKRIIYGCFLSFVSMIHAAAPAQDAQLKQKLVTLQKKTEQLQQEIQQLNQSMIKSSDPKKKAKKKGVHSKRHLEKEPVHNAPVTVHSLDMHPEELEFFPAALIADDNIVTYIAGMPIVSSPYLGSRPAYDGSDYIVNISSINRDIRLMQQRRRLYRSFDHLDYPRPTMPIVMLSGKLEPLMTFGNTFKGPAEGDVTLGSNELDVAASLNDKVEGYMGIAYDASPPAWSGQRVSNSSFNLNLGFVNIGDLDESPLYFTAGQIYAPFGRYSTAMVSPTLPMLMSRTKSRPFILGYKSQAATGPFVSIYGFSGDTTLGTSAVGGVNAGYIFTIKKFAGEVGASFISSLTNAGGMQRTGSTPRTTFGGFGSLTNGSENVRKTPGVGVHTSISFDRYNIIAEWVSATEAFREQDLSFNGKPAQPQAAQIEGGVTFMLFNRPSSLGAGYQWSGEALALNLAQQRVNAVYNISIWKDTVESIEYRHDFDYGVSDYANGAAPVGYTNLNTIGTGGGSDTVLIQLGIYF